MKLTLDDVLVKRNEAIKYRKNFRAHDGIPVGILVAEYDWGYWDAVLTIMKSCGMEEIDAKVVQ